MTSCINVVDVYSEIPQILSCNELYGSVKLVQASRALHSLVTNVDQMAHKRPFVKVCGELKQQQQQQASSAAKTVEAL